MYKTQRGVMLVNVYAMLCLDVIVNTQVSIYKNVGVNENFSAGEHCLDKVQRLLAQMNSMPITNFV